MIRRYAMSLSEALIALTVLGIVFAIVFPVIKYSSKVTEYKAAYQRSLNTLNKAYYEYLEGGMDKGNDTGTSVTKVNDPAYIGTTVDGVAMTTSSAIVDNIFKKHISTLPLETSDNVPFPGCPNTGVKFYSSDGMRYCVNYSTCAANSNYADKTCGEIWVDVNGAKGPNYISKNSNHPGDIYPIVIMKDRFVPGSTSDSDASTYAQNLYFGLAN